MSNLFTSGRAVGDMPDRFGAVRNLGNFGPPQDAEHVPQLRMSAVNRLMSSRFQSSTEMPDVGGLWSGIGTPFQSQPGLGDGNVRYFETDMGGNMAGDTMWYRRYIKTVENEQARIDLTPTQGVPVFLRPVESTLLAEVTSLDEINYLLLHKANENPRMTLAEAYHIGHPIGLTVSPSSSLDIGEGSNSLESQRSSVSMYKTVYKEASRNMLPVATFNITSMLPIFDTHLLKAGRRVALILRKIKIGSSSVTINSKASYKIDLKPETKTAYQWVHAVLPAAGVPNSMYEYYDSTTKKTEPGIVWIIGSVTRIDRVEYGVNSMQYHFTNMYSNDSEWEEAKESGTVKGNYGDNLHQWETGYGGSIEVLLENRFCLFGNIFSDTCNAK